MPNLNQVTLCGYLARDPELAYTPKGTAVAKCAVAVNRKWKDETGQEREKVTFVEFQVWQRSAENMGQYAKKGAPVLLTGYLDIDQWDDKATGQKRSKMYVVVTTWQLLERRAEAEQRRPEPRRTDQTDSIGRRRTIPASDPDMPPVEDDDVPF